MINKHSLLFNSTFFKDLALHSSVYTLHCIPAGERAVRSCEGHCPFPPAPPYPSADAFLNPNQFSVLWLIEGDTFATCVRVTAVQNCPGRSSGMYNCVIAKGCKECKGFRSVAQEGWGHRGKGKRASQLRVFPSPVCKALERVFP